MILIDFACSPGAWRLPLVFATCLSVESSTCPTCLLRWGLLGRTRGPLFPLCPHLRSIRARLFLSFSRFQFLSSSGLLGFGHALQSLCIACCSFILNLRRIAPLADDLYISLLSLRWHHLDLYLSSDSISRKSVEQALSLLLHPQLVTGNPGYRV